MNIRYFQMVEIHCRKNELERAYEYMEMFGFKVQSIVYERESVRINAVKGAQRVAPEYAVQAVAQSYTFD